MHGKGFVSLFKSITVSDSSIATKALYLLAAPSTPLRVAEHFKFQQNWDLPIAPSALYLLAAPSTPDEVKEDALEIAKACEEIDHKTLKELKDSQIEIDRLQTEITKFFLISCLHGCK